MNSYILTHLSDQTLLQDLATIVARDRATTARLLAHLAEVDSRKLYLPAGYPSMFAYCLEELHLCEQATFKRIRAARTAREYPAIFTAVAEGRLHLSGVVLLSPHLTSENAGELIAAANHRSKAEIEQMLAERFPRPDVPASIRALPLPSTLAQAGPQLSPGTVDASTNLGAEPHPLPVSLPVSATERPTDRAKLTPLSPQRFALQLTISQEMRDDLRYALELLGFQIPSGDVTQVLHRGLKALIGQLEKQKFAAAKRPRTSDRPNNNRRHIPAHVKRAVWKRDGGQCSFVSETGHRCPARKPLEFDHAQPVARGGQGTVSNVRLRCRAHNQHAAECTFGEEFMRRKRWLSKGQTAARRPQMEAQAAAAEEVISPLRMLGFRADEARRAAALCEDMPEASLEDRVRRALSYFHRPRTCA